MASVLKLTVLVFGRVSQVTLLSWVFSSFVTILTTYKGLLTPLGSETKRHSKSKLSYWSRSKFRTRGVYTKYGYKVWEKEVTLMDCHFLVKARKFLFNKNTPLISLRIQFTNLDSILSLKIRFTRLDMCHLTATRCICAYNHHASVHWKATF